MEIVAQKSGFIVGYEPFFKRNNITKRIIHDLFGKAKKKSFFLR